MEQTQKSKDKFLAILNEELKTIKQQLAEDIKNLGDPIDVALNKNDGLGDSNKALVYKDADGKKEKSGNSEKGEVPLDVKLNQQPSKGGSDEKASTAVGVKAGAAKGGNDVTAGQHAANFTSKTEGPKTKTGEPFDEKAKKEMNQMDKVVDEGTKTYVEAGAEKGGTDVTAGQHDANWKESAPKSDNEKRIADAIQLKEKYTPAELQAFIVSEAKKYARVIRFEANLEKAKKNISEI